MRQCIALWLVLYITTTSVLGQGLPRGLSEAEQQRVSEGWFQQVRLAPGEFSFVTPPPSSRAMAEWEAQQAIAITWTGFPAILKDIVRYAKDEVDVLIVTQNESSVRTYLESNGIDLSDHVEFVNSDYNTIWIRDYGPNPVYVNDVDSLVFVDWIYNRPRPKDDVISYAIGGFLDVPVYGTLDAPDDLVNTGGNFMSDGRGRGFSSALVLAENGPNNVYGSSNHDEAEVDGIMQSYMGIDEYVIMPVLPYDGIHHIDMHMKLLDESRIMVGQYPPDVADGPQIEANIQYVLSHFKQPNGEDYQVIRMPMPPDQSGRFPDQGGDYRTYTNALFVNKTILVPTYEEQYDTTALRIWGEAMPGYRIAGINCNQIIPLSGAIHCITKEVGVNHPLWISHFQPGTAPADSSIELEAEIRHVSGIAEAWMYYRVSGETEYDSVAMTSGTQDIWAAPLPAFNGGETVQYYFRAVSNDGISATRPMTAPEGYFVLRINESVTGTRDTRPNTASISVFPNPAHAITCVPLSLTTRQVGALGLYTIDGKPVQILHQGQFPAGKSKYFFNAGTLNPGIYVISIITTDFQESIPLFIK